MAFSRGWSKVGIWRKFVAQEVRFVVRVYANGQDFDLVAVVCIYN